MQLMIQMKTGMNDRDPVEANSRKNGSDMRKQRRKDPVIVQYFVASANFDISSWQAFADFCTHAVALLDNFQYIFFIAQEPRGCEQNHVNLENEAARKRKEEDGHHPKSPDLYANDIDALSP